MHDRCHLQIHALQPKIAHFVLFREVSVFFLPFCEKPYFELSGTEHLKATKCDDGRPTTGWGSSLL